jgi:hypothetical protein
VLRFFETDRAKKARQREEALEALLLAQEENPHSSEKAKKAIAYCQLNIMEYEHLAERDDTRWKLCQAIVVVGGVAATLAGTISFPQAWDWLAWIRSVPAAFVTIAAGVLTSFSYRENAVRFEPVAVALWNELALFLTHASPYNKGEAEDASAFSNAVCRLVEVEVHNWGALVRENRVDGNRPTVPSTPRLGATHAPQPTRPQSEPASPGGPTGP